MIHGGAIESINISATGNAHVLFCEPEACQAFYDKYPNGIDIDKNKGQTVFVEMGTEVDVISSQLVWNLSVGATRVVRAVGADMVITMGQLLKLAAMNNRKVEKILDSYVPGDVSSTLSHEIHPPNIYRLAMWSSASAPLPMRSPSVA